VRLSIHNWWSNLQQVRLRIHNRQTISHEVIQYMCKFDTLGYSVKLVDTDCDIMSVPKTNDWHSIKLTTKLGQIKLGTIKFVIAVGEVIYIDYLSHIIIISHLFRRIFPQLTLTCLLWVTIGGLLYMLTRGCKISVPPKSASITFWCATAASREASEYSWLPLRTKQWRRILTFEVHCAINQRNTLCSARHSTPVHSVVL